MKTTKSNWRYDGRKAANRGFKLTLYASALALVLQAWKGLKARPAKSLAFWIFGGILAFADRLQLLFPVRTCNSTRRRSSSSSSS